MEQRTDFKSLDKSLRKQMVIDTAITIFHRKGYRTATLDDVAHELGLSKAALYHYVSSKEALLSLIYIQALESFFANANDIEEMDLAPPEKLRFFIRNHIRNIIVSNLHMFAVFFSEENQLPEKQFQKIREEKRKYSKIVEKIIAEGIEQGCFRPLDPKLQAFAVIGMCNWLYKWYKPDCGGKSPEEIADHFLNFLENGYLQPSRCEEAAETKTDRRGKKMPDRKSQIMEELKDRAEGISSLVIDLEKCF